MTRSDNGLIGAVYAFMIGLLAAYIGECIQAGLTKGGMHWLDKLMIILFSVVWLVYGCVCKALKEFDDEKR
jgi:hypothetical protein